MNDSARIRTLLIGIATSVVVFLLLGIKQILQHTTPLIFITIMTMGLGALLVLILAVKTPSKPPPPGMVNPILVWKRLAFSLILGGAVFGVLLIFIVRDEINRKNQDFQLKHLGKSIELRLGAPSDLEATQQE